MDSIEHVSIWLDLYQLAIPLPGQCGFSAKNKFSEGSSFDNFTSFALQVCKKKYTGVPAVLNIGTGI
jgi:hypothetical protein